ncbi:MAG: hypothetical protein J0H42_29805 [Rhizobiales bacterium]|nr:hypothetical protein [Hyphomicrobiales bacterium]
MAREIEPEAFGSIGPGMARRRREASAQAKALTWGDIRIDGQFDLRSNMTPTAARARPNR